MVVYAFNPSYLDSKDGRIMVQGQPWQKVLNQQLGEEASVIPDSRAAEIDRIVVLDQPGQKNSQ
jgi:hypothetical protein